MDAGYRGEAGTVWHVMQRPDEPRSKEDFRLVEVFLSGGAPWGFTLRGGLEHREPLLITKVEEGSKAAAVGLQVADELVNINEIPLSGFRQEAICLVKGSHRTLSLVVKRRIKMVDLVAQKMPSENDVHVARSFLTKILRSSMRRNEPISRPHSWHSTKFNENQLEPTKTQSPPTPVWHSRYDASSSSADLTSSWEQTNLCRVSDQFSSLGSMDSLEHVPHSYPAGPLTPAKSNNSMEHLGGGGGGGGGKRDSAYSSFSTSSGTPDYTLSKSNTASTENVLFKVSQWDTGGKHMSNRNPQSETRPDDRLTYFQIPGCEGQHSEDQAGSRVSTSSRSSFGPVWHVPEKTKKTSSPSPPPPAPPTRSDSFAATKQHERVHSTGHFEEPHVKMAMDHRRSFNLSPNHDFDSFAQNAHSQVTANKQHSGNVQHHGDKSTFYPQPWMTTAPKAFNNTQETQSNGSSHHGQNNRRNLSTSSAVTASEQNENSNCYFCVTPNQPSQPFVTKDRNISTSSERMCLSPQTVTKTRYSLPPPQHATQAKAMEERGTPNAETPYMSQPVSRISEQRRSMPAQAQTPHTDVKHEVYNSKICPKATPILHSLSMDTNTNLDDGGDSKNMQRNERFATTLRNEILMRRAKLQKSKSAATLPATETELEEDQDVWKSSENATPTSNAYKDHLKEMQARVLKATSFRRKDLEPVLLESSELSTNYTRKESSLPPVSESVRSKSGPVARIGGRKRFPTEKKVKSFSEPNQIHHVGMKEDPSLAATPGAASYDRSAAKSHTDVRPQSLAGSRETVPPPTRFPEEEIQGGSSVPENQRLGTFAEYEERWSTQKKPAVEKRASGRYRSADNILDHGTEERHQSSSGFHERSRSSPSADVFAQRFPASPRNSESECSQTGEREPAEQPTAATGRSEPEREPPTATSHSLQEPRGDPMFSSAITDHTLANCSDSSGLPPLPAPLPTAEQCEGTVDKGPEQLRASSHTEIGRNNMETQRSPSPQFSPQRLSDKPPLSLPEDPSSNRFESVTEAQNPAVKKVPIRIIHSEAAAEKNCPFLRHPDPVPAETVTRVPSLTAGGQDSVFCAFKRQKDLYISTITDQDLKYHRDGTSEDQNNHRDSTSEDQNLHRDSTSEDQNLHRDSTSEDQNLHRDSTSEDQNHHRDSTSEDQNLHRDSTSEDQKRAELVRDIMGKDRSLVEILDQSRMRTTMDLMEGIFPQGEQLGEGQRRRGSVKQARPTETRKESPAAVTMVTSATYYSTSAPKAEMLMKMKDMPEEEEDSEEELDLDLANKKQELIDSLTKKLQVLREARESLQEDVLDNNALGDEVEEQVQARCKPNELDKFRMFVGDLDKVVSLLLSLSGRLARVENALNCPEEDVTAEERRTLMEKRKLLIRQHEDAKELKENLDRRERVVCEILSSSLHQEALTDYEHFVKMKSALIIEQRKLDDKIKLGEEQLKCLLDSLPLDQRLL